MVKSVTSLGVKIVDKQNSRPSAGKVDGLFVYKVIVQINS